MRWWILGYGVLAGVLGGCSPTLSRLVADLETRHVASCLHYEGSMGGIGPLSGQGSLKGVTVTGGFPIELCMDERQVPIRDVERILRATQPIMIEE